MPDAFAIAQQDGVDRTDRGSIAGKLGQQRHDRLLAWMRDVQAREAHALRGVTSSPSESTPSATVRGRSACRCNGARARTLHLHAGLGRARPGSGADQAQQNGWSTADWHAGGSPVTRA